MCPLFGMAHVPVGSLGWDKLSMLMLVQTSHQSSHVVLFRRRRIPVT